MKRIIVASLFLVLGSSAGWSASTATLAGIDVYRSDRITADDIRARYGEPIKSLVDKKNRLDRSKNSEKLAQDIIERIEDDIKTQWKVPFAKLVWTESSEKEGRLAYITIDVVEGKDERIRLAFRLPGDKSFEDPQGLFALWDKYTELGWSLVRSGEVSMSRTECRSLFCQWGDPKPELKAMDDKLAELAGSNEKMLVNILTNDKDPKHRAAAVYVLAYLPSGNKVAHLLTPALLDPDMTVRIAALRVFGDLAVYHTEVYLPIEQIVAAVDFPNSEERSKALAVLVGLSGNAYYTPGIVHFGGDRLVDLLRLKQPLSRDLAYTVLTLISKENYGAADYEAWQRWVEKTRSKTRPPAATKPEK
ncbi:MAG: HEAT repeat domain-containing protein [Elusimicrobia bacterium]|nr:HEAT repeat domain-containing protein [Elusimicrobiota bacterium]